MKLALLADRSNLICMQEASSTREHLLTVGLRQVRLNGYTATGVKEILQLAGVPKGSFYHHFSSKEAFASELLQRYADAEIERIHRILDDTTVAPLERLRVYFGELATMNGFGAEVSGCLMGSLSLEMSGQSEALQSQLHSLFEFWQEAIARVLREAVQRNDLSKTTQTDELAEFLLNGYEGALVRMKADQSNRPLGNFLRLAFDVVLRKSR